MRSESQLAFSHSQGHKLTRRSEILMSASPPKADASLCVYEYTP
jgi:hypothetical protein